MTPNFIPAALILPSYTFGMIFLTLRGANGPFYDILSVNNPDCNHWPHFQRHPFGDAQAVPFQTDHFFGVVVISFILPTPQWRRIWAPMP